MGGWLLSIVIFVSSGPNGAGTLHMKEPFPTQEICLEHKKRFMEAHPSASAVCEPVSTKDALGLNRKAI